MPSGTGPYRLRSRQVVTPEGVRPATVVVEGGRIAALDPYETAAGAPGRAHDLGDFALLPGLVDSHVHINEPGRTDWEGFATATRAAAAGGITTLVDMPLNSIPVTISVSALDAKRRAAAGQCTVDVGFWGGVVPGNERNLRDLWQAGALGFKCFLVPSGVDEFPAVEEADLRAAMPILAALGAPLLAHAELPGPLARAAAQAAGDRRTYATFLATRPAAAESQAIELLARLARGTRIHIVHVSSSAGVQAVQRARGAGLAFTAETCPHYLSFSADEIPDGRTEYKCAPPIRDTVEREALWQALADGTLDLIASDHSPSLPALKHREDGDFLAAWGGIASLQIALPAVWRGARARGYGLDAIARWMSAAPARLAGIAARKGAIAVGRDADLVVFDADREWTVTGAALEHRHPLTPYDGRTVRGRVVQTYLRGELVYDEGRFPSPCRGDVAIR